jgi:two-component system OmpR family response regulator
MRLLYATDGRIDGYLVKALREAGHVVEATDEAIDAVEIARSGDYQAVILDWSAPPTDSAARIAAAVDALVLAIVPSADDAARAALLRAGADACLVRPVAFIELEARLDALARLAQRARPGREAAEMVEAEQAVRLGELTIALSRREFQVMAFLLGRTGEVIGLEQLHQQVWGEAVEPRLDLVRVCVSRLRRKLEAAGAAEVLSAVRGHGYIVRLPAALERPTAQLA